MRRFCAQFIRRIFLAAGAYSFLLSVHAYAVTTSWNTNSGGDFSTAANWGNGVPDSDDTAVFNRGFVAYEVNFPGGFIFDPPVIYTIDSLRVRTNEVSFVYSIGPFQSAPSLSVLNPALSIVIGENTGDVAIMNMTLNSLSGANASIGRDADSNGTLNVGGTFNLSGALNVGESGTGTMNVTGGGTVASANGYIGVNAGSNGQVTVSGAGSTWANSNSLFIGRSASGTNAQLNVNDGGVVSATNGLRVNPSGRLAGNGLIQGNVENLGRVVPGISSPTSVGTLHIDGSYGQSIAAELFVDLAAADSFDKLDVGGDITFGGRLDVSLGYSPALGATFDILDWTGTQNGTFFDIDLPLLSAGLMWNKSQLYTSGVLSVVPGYFQPGDVITHRQDIWGDPSTAAWILLSNNFDSVYAATTVLEVGIPGPGGFSMVFSSASAVHSYLPAVGPAGQLNADLVDPTSSSAGFFGGEVVALQLNVDFSDAGLILGALGIPFGDLVIHDYTGLPQVNGLTVRQFLGEANTSLGGAVGYSVNDAGQLASALNASFEEFEGELFASQWAQDHLRIPGDFNLDRAVNAADYVVWRKTDGTLDGYNEWRAHFGYTASSGSGASVNATVPEPATMVILIVTAAGVLTRRCRLAWRVSKLINS